MSHHGCWWLGACLEGICNHHCGTDRLVLVKNDSALCTVDTHNMACDLGMGGIVWEFLLRHDDVIKWKRFPRYWPFVRGIHQEPVNSPHKGQWHGTLMFSLIRALTNSWANNGDAGDWRRHRAHYCVTVMICAICGIVLALQWLIMTTIASQITSLTVVYSTVYSDADQRNIKAPRHWPLCGEFTGTSEFPAQRASYAENVSIWWRHHGCSCCNDSRVYNTLYTPLWKSNRNLFSESNFIEIIRYQ